MHARKDVDKINTLIAVLSSSFLTLLITNIMGYFGKRNSRKNEQANLRIKLYSPVVRFMRSVNFLEHALSQAIDTIENYLFKEYDCLSPNIEEKLLKLKASVVRGEVTELTTKDFYKLYLPIQIEYNKAKKSTFMNSDIRFTNMDFSAYSLYNCVLWAFWIVLYVLLIISEVVAEPIDWNAISNITTGLGFMAFITTILVGIIFLVNLQISRKVMLRNWETILFKGIQDEQDMDEIDGEQDNG